MVQAIGLLCNGSRLLWHLLARVPFFDRSGVYLGGVHIAMDERTRLGDSMASSFSTYGMDWERASEQLVALLRLGCCIWFR